MKDLARDPVKDPTLLFEAEIFAGAHTGGQKPLVVIGVDEAGRGAIAGPVSVGVQAIFETTTAFPKNLRDSKILSEKRREWLLPSVQAWGVGAVGFAQAHEIDRFGLTKMLALAARRALVKLHEAGVDVENAAILLDGSHDWLSVALKKPLPVITRVAADRQNASVAAASLRAKVLRDRHMKILAQEHNHYGWESNKGYGAKAHYEGINAHGLTDQHRKTWIRQ